jgi:hypothetical protein
VASAQSTNAGSYTVVVTNNYGSITSLVAALTVKLPPSITTPPASQNVNQGGNASFSVVAAGTAPLSYQWLKNGGTIAGATLSGYAITGVQTSDGASYSVVVTNVAGSATSANAILTVNIAPTITTDPQNKATLPGYSAIFTVAANGTAPLGYSWQKNGGALSDGGNIFGSATTALTVTNVQAADVGSYSVTVTNAAGEAISDSVTLLIAAPSSLTHVGIGPDGSFQFRMNGTVGGDYDLEVSSNFFNWTFLDTFSGRTNAPYSDYSFVTNSEARYYRLKLNP